MTEDIASTTKFNIVWVDNLQAANKLCPKKYWKYFDESTVPKFLTGIDESGKKYGFVIDNEQRPLAGIAVYFEGVQNDENVDKSLPYIWEIGSVSEHPNSESQQPCKFAQKGAGTILIKDVAERVDYKFWFKTASKDADSYWRHIVKSGQLGRVINLQLIGYSSWNCPMYLSDGDDTMKERYVKSFKEFLQID